MKHVVSISLGSSKRDHAVEIDLLGERCRIERKGTNGDLKEAVRLIRELDGEVDAFGMGGIDLYVMAGNRRYTLRDALPLAKAAVKTPIVDGSGLKNTLERRVVRRLVESEQISFRDMKVLVVAAVDRFGLAESLSAEGADLIFGDLIFTLGLPFPIRSLKSIDRIARMIAPVVCRLPFKMLYPTGSKQEEIRPRFGRYYEWADMIAGDFHFIRRYLPERLDGKIVLTNTVTPADIELLAKRGARQLITTTPELEGRSFGTNVMEALLVALSGKRPEELLADDYERLLEAFQFDPRRVDLTKVSGSSDNNGVNVKKDGGNHGR